MRVALVTEIAAPYRIPVFNELDELLGGELEIFFTSVLGERDWRIPVEEIRFRHQVLGAVTFSIPYRGDRQPVYIAPPLLPHLLRGKFDLVVVGGWSHLECAWALAYARLRGRPFVLWSETPLLGPLARRPLRSAWKRAVIRTADSFAVPGPSAARYLEAHGAPSHRIHTAPNAVDTVFWSQGGRARSNDVFTLLYSGRLVESKGVDVALRAFGASRLESTARLLVAGDGPLRAVLERQAPPRVEFLGPQSREALRTLYHSADVLVFPSRYDPWGLVLNEAACAGLAAVGSDGAGATRDLIRDGENGLVVRAGDVGSLRDAFDRLADDPALASRLGAAAADIARTHTPLHCAEGLAAAIAQASERLR